VSCDVDYMNRSLRAQLRYADKYPSRFVVVLGDDELDSRTASLKRMDTGDEFQVSLDELADAMREQAGHLEQDGRRTE